MTHSVTFDSFTRPVSNKKSCQNSKQSLFFLRSGLIIVFFYIQEKVPVFNDLLMTRAMCLIMTLKTVLKPWLEDYLTSFCLACKRLCFVFHHHLEENFVTICV